MTDVLLVFEVHQPYRIRRDYFWENRAFKKLEKNELLESYFDLDADGDIFRRASTKCYLPSNRILLDVIDEHKHDRKDVRVAFSLSGVFLEQCERFNRDVLDSFKQLAETGRVEFLGQTHYHSLSSLYPDRVEFVDQVTAHRQAVKDLLGYTPRVFENTELIYHNEIAKTVEDLGYEGIFTEGADRIIGSRSPNQLFQAKGCESLKVLLRNYRLTDDIAFRFSNREWSEWPLTAIKYASWLQETPGQCICIFLDYETFGEHHWPETGIHEFLRSLPAEILAKPNLNLVTPTKALTSHKPRQVLDVPSVETLSWADIERSTHSWIGNDMQWAFYTKVREAEHLVKELNDPEYTRLWRYFQISDHLYYMFTAGGGPGAVHNYFSPYGKPVDAFLAAQAALMDFLWRLGDEADAANQGFLFQVSAGEQGQTGLYAQSLRGMLRYLEAVSVTSIEYHRGRGDFETWIRDSLRDNRLADEIHEIDASKLVGEKLRAKLIKTISGYSTNQLKKRMRQAR